MNLEKRFPFFWHVAIGTESQKARRFLSKHALVRTDDSQTELIINHWNRRSEPGTPGAELKEENLPSALCFHT